MPELPTGTVTFLFTDVEGSTKLWEEAPEHAGTALARHDDIIEEAVGFAGGSVVRPRGEGDSRFCVFPRPSEALAAALRIQLALQAERWDTPRPVKVRIGIHTGEADLRAGDYYGGAVNRCARLRGIAHGGQCLVSGTTAQLVENVPDEVTLRDLGDHVLRDIAHPERVFQLTHPELPADFPPLLSLDERRNNLPTELSSFVGREAAVQDVKRLLGEVRLLTLHGAAGCGKTRLALEVADELIGEYPDGVWFVDLAPVQDGALVVEPVASALGVRETERPGVDGEAALPGRGLRERVLDHLRARRLLLVVDNCEHVVSQAADLIDEILRTCAGVSILATSREALGIVTETAWKVPSMTTPDPDDMPSLDELSGFEAFRLFVERARQRRPDFEVTEREAPAIARICHRLDGIPLAIELAAARVKLLTPEQIDGRLNERFRLLVGGSRTALERQQTLRATIDWSYEPLSEQERALFRRLGVFSGGFTLEAAEAVCAGKDVDDVDVLGLLAQLVDKSMVEADPQGIDVRYRMLETFRQYARERMLHSGETEDVRTRHRDWYLELAERAAKTTGKRRIAWLDRLEVEHDNLRAAQDWSASQGGDHPLRFVVALWQFWLTRGHLSEGRARCAAALAEGTGSAPALRADALRGASTLAWVAYDFTAAAELAGRWGEAAEASGDRLRIGHSLVGSGYVPFLSGDLAGARERWQAAAEIGRELGADELVMAALHPLASVEAHEGRRESARAMLEEVLATARAADDLDSIVGACSSLAQHARVSGDYDAAENYLEECVRISEELGDRSNVAWALLMMSSVARNRGETDRAREFLDRSRLLQPEVTLPYELWAIHTARIEESAGNLDEADRLFAEIVAQEDSVPGVVPSAWEGLARIAHARERYRESLEYARTAVRAWAVTGVIASIPDALAVIAGSLARLGRAQRAARLFGAVDALRAAFGEVVHANEIHEYEGDIGLARAALTPEEFEREWSAGGALNLEAAVAYALEQHPAAATSA